jgi:formylglycine-generating enzyme required for sulfatase activity
VAATGASKPDDQGWGRGKRPVINVSWRDANAYAEWLSAKTGLHYRLPTEAEWEYATRASTTGNYAWGDEDAGNYAWFSNNSNAQTHPVGEKKPNGFGLYDVAGNVWEWVQDCYAENYEKAPKDGSARDEKECPSRVLRGGSWLNLRDDLRSASRDWSNPDTRYYYVGFRLAQD